jgi:hypothetical protein
MAELAVPIIVLGSLYILSNQEKKKEFFTQNDLNVDLGSNKKSKTDKNTNKNKKSDLILQEGYSNYNTNKMQEIKVDSNSNNAIAKEVSNINNFRLMTGEHVNQNTLKHNNMQPFYGSKIKGLNIGDKNSSILDSKQGLGSQSFSKSEQGPLFKPDENVNFVNGVPNNSDFIQSRMNESMKISNVTLWEPQRVGPGLNLGYGSQNEQGLNVGGVEGAHGFNSGMMNRETWMPKSVDNLRVDTNPKMTYDLNGHQGPPISIIKTQGNIGKVETHIPEKFYNSGPDRWFTTTGAEQHPAIRSTQILPMENRIDTTREYYGVGQNTEAHVTYTKQEYEDSKRQNLAGNPIINPSAIRQNNAAPNDYNIQSLKLLPNNRTTDRDNDIFGSIYGAAKSVVTPLMDILNPTRKENMIGNLRQSGNVNGGPTTGHLFNRNDMTKTTNREMTTGKIDLNYLNVQGQNHRGDAYQVSEHVPVQNQRDTTSVNYIGGGKSSNAGIRPYNAEYAQDNNVNKTYELRPNQGNMSLFNNYNNSHVSRNEDLVENNRNTIHNGGPSIIPSGEFMGEINGLQTYDNINNTRMDSSLLNAFKNNPYTKPLNSVA